MLELMRSGTCSSPWRCSLALQSHFLTAGILPHEPHDESISSPNLLGRVISVVAMQAVCSGGETTSWVPRSAFGLHFADKKPRKNLTTALHPVVPSPAPC